MIAFQVSDWKPHQKNTLKGFFTLTLPSGLVIRECMLHEKGESRWVGLPAKPYKKSDGSTSYTPMIDFTSKAARERFQGMAIEAFDQFFEKGGDK